MNLDLQKLSRFFFHTVSVGVLSSLLSLMIFVSPQRKTNFVGSQHASLVPSTANNQNVDTYWEQVGLDWSALDSVLRDSFCFANRLSFLTCVRMSQILAERLGGQILKNLSLDLKTSAETDSKPYYEEKEFVEAWSQIYQEGNYIPQKQFETLLNYFRKSIPSSKKSSSVAAALNAYLSIQIDPHTYLTPKAYYDEVVSQQETKSNPFGVIVKRFGRRVAIRKVLENSPAQEAGLERGDMILELDGRKVKDFGPSHAMEVLRNPKFQKIVLRLQRGLRKFEVQLTKNERSYPSVTAQDYPNHPGVFVLSLHRFASGTCALARSLIQQRDRRSSMQGLILDLRDNPGGQVIEASCVLSLFVGQRKPLFQVRFLEDKQKSETYFANEKALYTGPLSVLINSGTASAGEIVSGSLQDLNRAQIVGERSFGKGTFQDGEISGINEQVMLFRTQGMYFFPSGWTAQLQGVQPDYTVNMDPLPAREEDLYYRPMDPQILQKKPMALAKNTFSILGFSSQEPFGQQVANLFGIQKKTQQSNSSQSLDIDFEAKSSEDVFIGGEAGPLARDSQLRRAVLLSCPQCETR